MRTILVAGTAGQTGSELAAAAGDALESVPERG